MSSNDIGEWYKGIPQLTRYWFTAGVIVPLSARFGIVGVFNLLLDWDSLFYNFHIWRPFTAAFYTRLGFPYLIWLYFLYNYSIRLETGVFEGRPADYFYMLLVNFLSTVLIALAIDLPAYFDVLILAALYIWCQINRDEIVSFWFGTKFKASYFPWVLLAFNFIISGRALPYVLGIFVGHVYFFLKFKYPLDFGGHALLETPRFLYQYFPNARGSVSGFGVPPSSRERQETGNEGIRSWGSGQRLGE